MEHRRTPLLFLRWFDRGGILSCNKSLTTGLVSNLTAGVPGMLVTMQNSELVSKLVKLADGDIDLVQLALRTMSRDGRAADLEQVVNFIVDRSKERTRVQAVA